MPVKRLTRIGGLRSIQSSFRAAIEDALVGGVWGKRKWSPELLADVRAWAKDPLCGVFVYENDLGTVLGAAVVKLPFGAVSTVPQVVGFSARGSVAKEALVEAVTTFVREAGYTRFWAINGTGKTDAVWARTFRKAGPAKRIASVLEVDIGEPNGAGE